MRTYHCLLWTGVQLMGRDIPMSCVHLADWWMTGMMMSQKSFAFGGFLKFNSHQEAVINGDPVQEGPLKSSVAPRVFCFPYRNPLNPPPKPYSSLVALSPPFPHTAQPSEHGGFCFAGPYLGWIVVITWQLLALNQ